MVILKLKNNIEYHKKYYLNNKEKIKQRSKKRYQKYTEEILEVQKIRYLENKEKIGQKIKEYQQTEKGKKVSYKANKKYQQTDKGKNMYRVAAMKHYWKNRERKLLEMKKYRQTEKGKIAHLKSNAKRKRSLNWVQMFENPFDEDVKIEWHHINDCYVVAIPKELHRMYGGKYHREMCMDIVKQVYLRET